MSIKSRLRLSYIAMPIIPFILIIIVSNIFMSYIGGEAGYGLGNKIQKNNNPLIQIISSNNKFMKNINMQILQNPDKLLDQSYLSQLDKSIDAEYTGIALRKSSKIIYSSDYIKNDINEVSLPSFSSDTLENSNKKIHILGQQYFYFSDGSEGSIFFLVNTEGYKKVFERSSIFLILFSLIILVIITGIFTYWMSRSFIKPLKELEKAANEIKKGNLDYTLNINSKDEIGEVSHSFEEMRLRLKNSLEMQQQYEENRKELISNISHDLKTPITSIKGYIEGIKDGIADTPEKMDKYVNTIYTKANYMDSLINDLFLFSKLDLNKITFKFQLVDMISYLKDCVEEINFELDHSNTDLSLDVPEKSIFVNIDVQQLKRTILNIVENSIKYKTDRELKIDIILEEDTNNVIIEIRDNGKGIPKESLPYIFDRFYRADTSRETIIGGSGLGLAITKKIIEEHKGTIWVHSEQNKGTSIFFSLKKYQVTGKKVKYEKDIDS